MKLLIYLLFFNLIIKAILDQIEFINILLPKFLLLIKIKEEKIIILLITFANIFYHQLLAILNKNNNTK